MEAWLRQNPPVRDQYRSPRRAKQTGLVVIHTAESVMDNVGPDTGAEAVAKFIKNRTSPGSYHDIVDSDSGIKLVRYSDEAYQDGTGSNPFAMSISFALKAANWPEMSGQKVAAFLNQGARAFDRQQEFLRRNGLPTTPLRRVTRAESNAGKPGFISHGERDPGRRSDPGRDFPWSAFFHACELAINDRPQPEPTKPEPVEPAPIPVETKMFFVYSDGSFDWGTDLVTRRRFDTQDQKNAWVELIRRHGGTVSRITLSTADQGLLTEVSA